jgi:hypothetical protein
MLKKFMQSLRLKYRRRRFRTGATLCRFIAPDVRRDVEVVDASELEQGFVSARVRTWNILYAAKGITPMPDFSEPRRIRIAKLWEWKGSPWGGPIPDEEPEFEE